MPLKSRRVIVRGPQRISQQRAEEDAAKLLRASRHGMDAVRKVQREVNAKK